MKFWGRAQKNQHEEQTSQHAASPLADEECGVAIVLHFLRSALLPYRPAPGGTLILGLGLTCQAAPHSLQPVQFDDGSAITLV